MLERFLSVHDHLIRPSPPPTTSSILDRGAVDRLDLGRGLPLWGVRPRRAGLCPEAVLNRRFRAEAGACSLTRPAACRRTRPRGRASPSLLGGELLNLTYPPCLTPPQHRSRLRDRDLRGGCPPAPRAGGQLAQPGLTPVPGRFEDSVVVVTRSTRGAPRSSRSN